MRKIKEKKKLTKANLNPTSHIPPHTSEKGITLIALVITIIVMLILVAVTISMAVDGGLFNYAGMAVGETQNAIDAEQEIANGKIEIDGTVYNSIEEYVNETGDIVGVDGEIFSSIYGKTEEYEDENGDIAVIPKGFSVGKSDGINTIEEGLVIQDAKGNQFVWIPVEVTDTDTETSIASFYRSEWENNERGTTKYTNESTYHEPYENGYTGEANEYNEMESSVFANKGFYIGRYEAGSTTPRAEYEEDGTTRKSNGTTTMVVKRDAYPYNYVGWGATMRDYTSDVVNNNLNQGKGALLLSKELYGTEEEEGKYGVKSTLCYGIMWDAMLDFIKSEKNVTNSTGWGNLYDSNWTIDRQTAEYSDDYGQTWQKISDLEDKNLTKTGSILLTTGADDSFAAKNIYDVAGNTEEWTMEVWYSSSSDRITRGSSFNGTRFSVLALWKLSF